MHNLHANVSNSIQVSTVKYEEFTHIQVAFSGSKLENISAFREVY